jgi:short-subunit dehydrogenase
MKASWAVITGASAGIGEGFARALADAGSSLLLCARRAERLKRLADELPTEVRPVQADLAGAAGRDRLWAEVQALDPASVDLLVNNAGFGLHRRFEEGDRARLLQMVRVNVEAATDLAHRYVELRRAQGGGALINVASVVGLRPVPGDAVYAASKAYLVSLSLALSVEQGPCGVRVLALCPGPVPTEFQQLAGTRLDGVSSGVAIPVEQVVREGLQALSRGQTLLVPGRAMRSISRVTSLMPPRLQAWLSGARRRLGPG